MPRRCRAGRQGKQKAQQAKLQQEEGDFKLTARRFASAAPVRLSFGFGGTASIST
jgi:hypothetical protein